MKWPLCAQLVLLGALVCGGCPSAAPYVAGNPRARLTTSLGEVVIELLEPNAPQSVANFEQYVQDGFYDGTLFHRVIPGFVIQGGGYTPGLVAKATRDPILSEANNGLKNLRGTVGMARGDARDSATSQFYINLADNPALDATLTAPGYAVFGQIIQGMDVVDQIAAVPTGPQGDFSNVPTVDVLLQSATLEPGPEVLSSEWDYYLRYYRYNAQVNLRDMLVTALQYLMSSR
jgi:cyclophilin family peptidyl-prolyl cis-trans isomerase